LKKRNPVSLVVITLNEANRIWRLFESADFADEVIVVDSGSEDETVRICEEAGARVIYHPWPGYAKQKQFAMEQAKYEWILSLDADEALSEKLAAEIREAIDSAKPEVAAFSMPRISRYLGRWIRHGGWYPDRKTRLVRRGCGRWEGEGIHEKLVVNGEIEKLKNPIFHYGYRDISEQINTINNYSRITTDHRPAMGGWYVVAGVFHAIGKFIECYIYKLGFLDGLQGLIIAMNSSFYVFLKHAKSWEKGREKK
jgi:glycosyltransferase involved in cell wall biosynthesis